MYDPPLEAELKTTIAIKGALLGLSQLLATDERCFLFHVKSSFCSQDI